MRQCGETVGNAGNTRFVTVLYVIQVRTGSENKTINEINSKISGEICKSCYTPLRDERCKVEGKWITKKKILFPGYIFVDSDDIKELHYQLRLITGYTRLISIDREPISVTHDELELIEHLVNTEHVMEVSEGIIVGSTLKINRGPLKGLEGLIVNINRHKRKAWLETDMFGRRQIIEVGLEITTKV